jgi:hypothetical protein
MPLQVALISGMDYSSNSHNPGPEAFLPDPISRRLASEPIVKVSCTSSFKKLFILS